MRFIDKGVFLGNIIEKTALILIVLYSRFINILCFLINKIDVIER